MWDKHEFPVALGTLAIIGFAACSSGSDRQTTDGALSAPEALDISGTLGVDSAMNTGGVAKTSAATSTGGVASSLGEIPADGAIGTGGVTTAGGATIADDVPGTPGTTSTGGVAGSVGELPADGAMSTGGVTTVDGAMIADDAPGTGGTTSTGAGGATADGAMSTGGVTTVDGATIADDAPGTGGTTSTGAGGLGDSGDVAGASGGAGAGGTAGTFFNSTPDWSEPFVTLDTNTWTPEVSASGEGNFEFEFYNASSNNLKIKNGRLYIYPGLTRNYVIGPGQAVLNPTNIGSDPPSNFAPGSVVSLPGAVTTGSLTEEQILGCGLTTTSGPWATGCSDWSGRPFYMFDLGTGCTDDGTAWGSPGRCVVGSGFYTYINQDPTCTGSNCAAYWSILPPVTSARVSTKLATAPIVRSGFKYGRLEIKAKTPSGDWLWPAIWMLPSNQTGTINPQNPTGTGKYGQWPRSGEIDILESRGNSRACSEVFEKAQSDSNATAVGGVQSFASTLHWGPYVAGNQYARTHTEYSVLDTSATLDGGFHVYGLRWNPTGLYTYIDSDSSHVLEVSFVERSFEQRATTGSYQHCLKDSESTSDYDCILVETIPAFSSVTWNSKGAFSWPTNAGPFDQPFYLVMNVAVGGTTGYFPDEWCSKPWQSNTTTKNYYPVGDFLGAQSQWFSTWSMDGTTVSDNAAMEVEEIRYWQESNAGAFGELSPLAKSM